MKKPRIHLICSAHLDPVWQWQWEEGCAEALTTFRIAIQLLDEFPAFVFTHNEAVLYQWVEKYDPKLFGAIRKKVRRKQWCIGGGWYLQPDLNLTDSESILRQIMLGRRYFYEQFRALPRVAYNFDVFGHSSGLPQILKATGYEMYIHMRPQPEQLELPADFYRWRGIDGTEIAAYRPQFGFYHHETDHLEDDLMRGIELALQLERDVPIFWGLGDHGGGATRKDLQMLEAFIRKEKRVEIVYSTPERLYTDLKPHSDRAPLFDGELQRCFTGCYTSMSRLKRRRHENLGLLLQTEALCAARWWRGAAYPDKKLERAWYLHLFNDFHDILPGSGTHLVERDALEGYGTSAEILRRLRFESAVKLTGNTADADTALCVLNHRPLPQPLPVEVECMLDYRPRFTGKWHLELVDSNGTVLPSQEESPNASITYNGWRRKIAFMAESSGIGATDYRIRVKPGSPKARDASKPKLDYQLDAAAGLVEQLYADGTPCLAGPLLTPLWIDDPGDSWGDGCDSYRTIAQEFKPRGRVKTVVDGPVRCIHQSHLVAKTSSVFYQWIGYKQLPLLEVRARFTINEKHRMLKLRIPTPFQHLLCEIPGAAINRASDGQEFPHGRWMILSQEKNDGPALAVINSGQHGYDFADGTVQLSVLRTPLYCQERNYPLDRLPAKANMDQGSHEVRLLFLAGAFDQLVQSVPHYAEWLNAPSFALAHLTVQKAKKWKTRRPLSIALSIDQVRLLAVKRSLDKKALIVRLQESCGRVAPIRLTVEKRSIDLEFQPWEIKTVRFEKSAKPQCVDCIFEK
ncbi:alpha-mannosidase [candidate division KSB1 bacterium]|nr:alpha-mannosidase [candidate division KSB1 bacterium]